MEKNKFTTYLLYAIGEIILVVIGILLAVSINDWNNERKQKQEEVKLLSSFRQSIFFDQERLTYDLEMFAYADSSIRILLNHMEKDLPYVDSLALHFGIMTAVWAPRIDLAVYESTTAVDLNNISNEELRREIISYYSWAKGNFSDVIGRYTLIIENASANIFNTRFKSMWDNSQDGEKETMIPHDFESLKQDLEFLYFLRTLKNQLYWYRIDPLVSANQKIDELLIMLDENIAR